jgi:hypothetical protein
MHAGRNLWGGPIQGFSILKELTEARESISSAFWFSVFGLTALLAAGFPVLFVALAHWWPPASGRGTAYVIIGIMAILGAAANFVAMLASHMNLMFGGSNSSQGETAFIWIIPLFQAFFGLASIMAGCSFRFADWLAL